MSRRLLVGVVVLGATAACIVLFATHRERAFPAPASTSPAEIRDSDVPVTGIATEISTLRDAREKASGPIEAGKDCPKKKTPFDGEESDEEIRARTLALSNELAKTDDADYLLAAALLSQSRGSDRSMKLLSRASDIAPRNRLVAWNRLTLCRNSGEDTCDIDYAQANAIEVDGSNGAVWMEIAMRRLAESQPSRAIADVRRAIAAPRIDTYFIDHVLLMERALASRSDLSYRDRVFRGIGYSAAMTVPYYRITRHCETVAESVGVWIELCDRLGAKMSVDGRTLLDQAIGRALRKIAAVRSGDKDWIKRSTAEYEAFRAHYQALMANPGSHALLENDEVVLRQYIESFSTYGELEAQRRLKAEAQRLREDPDYDRCNFVSNWTSR